MSSRSWTEEGYGMKLFDGDNSRLRMAYVKTFFKKDILFLFPLHSEKHTARLKCIRDMCDFSVYDFHRIETNVLIQHMVCHQVDRCCLGDLLLFRRSDGDQTASGFPNGSGFHLNKNNCGSVQHHKINFRMLCSVSSFEAAHSQLCKICLGFPFPPDTGIISVLHKK